VAVSDVQISRGRTAVAGNDLAIEALFAATVDITSDLNPGTQLAT